MASMRLDKPVKDRHYNKPVKDRLRSQDRAAVAHPGTSFTLFPARSLVAGPFFDRHDRCLLHWEHTGPGRVEPATAHPVNKKHGLRKGGYHET
jgi:hypothetical protein